MRHRCPGPTALNAHWSWQPVTPSLERNVHDDDVPKRPLRQRVYAFLFRFLGPAQLGSSEQPETGPADASYACPVCGRPMSEHTYTSVAERRRVICPAPPLQRD